METLRHNYINFYLFFQALEEKTLRGKHLVEQIFKTCNFGDLYSIDIHVYHAIKPKTYNIFYLHVQFLKR